MTATVQSLFKENIAVAKLPFRGIAQIATAQPPPSTTAAPVPPPSVSADDQPRIRPLGYSDEQAEAAVTGSIFARWWASLKRVLLDPPR
jgi:hypothetical protein